MKKRILIFSILALVVLGIYLNRSYSHIYSKINVMNLKSSNTKETYTIGNKSSNAITYVALGDSLTAGVGTDSYKESYPYQLSQYFTEIDKKQIILKPQAIPGAKTIDVINKLLDPTIKIQPDIITLLIGVNDIHGGVSDVDFKNNYELILKRITQETKAKIYIINIPYIGAKSLILPPENYYFNSKTQQFNKIIEKLASDYDAKYIDLYTPNLQIQDTEYYSSDLFHPSFIGYKAWGKIIYDNFN